MIRTPQHSLWARLREKRLLLRVVVIAATFVEQQNRAIHTFVPHVVTTSALIVIRERKDN